MTDHDDALYLTYIAEAAARIERSATPRGRDALHEDEELRDATIYRLQTLAESTQRLSPELKAAHPEIPWDDIASFRNRAVHGYLGINLDIVWDIVEHDLPNLARTAHTELSLRRQRER
ncbi:MAG: DUF86 domain-containing protein [Actinobacteria bacterium]|nr:DUF86 domain-containing protein [Actinomycetota bacterium]